MDAALRGGAVSVASTPAGGAAAAGAAAADGGGRLRVLLIGEEHVRAKVARHYALLERSHGVETHFFVDDRSGITRDVQRTTPMRVHYAPNPASGLRGLLGYWAAFRRCFEEVRPDVVEVYTSINFKVILPMMAYAALRGVPRVGVCRGELYPPVLDAFEPVARAAMLRALRSCQLLIYKELYMEELLERYCPGVPRLAWTNAIPVGPEPSLEREGNEVLFLNFFKEWRNLDLIIRAAPRVRSRVPDVRFRLVGGTDGLRSAGSFYAELDGYERALRELIRETGCGEYVEILPFTTEVEPYYAAAKAYLLPADLVFCNYALLEAMERGVPPIVSDERDPGARRIVEDGVSGRVVPLTPDALADAIVDLLSDEPRRRRMAIAARRTIEREFDLVAWVGTLAGAYRRLAARRPAAES
jgi:glycosyltransferase involved in cell wall biosynthesis